MLFGFIVIGVGLFLLGVIVIVLKGDINELVGCVYFIFVFVFIIVIYLCLGVFVSVLCIGIVVYEMSIVLFLLSEIVG